MMKSIIIDSNIERRENFKDTLLSDFSSFSNVYSFAERKKAFQILQREKIDVIFIYLDEESNEVYEWLTRINRESVEVIFLTQNNQVVLQGLSLRVTDVILIPINEKNLSFCIKQLENTIRRKREISLVLHSINVNRLKQNKSMFIKTAKSYIHIWMHTITHLEADGNYTYLYLDDKKKILTSNHLKKYEDILCQCDFFRVNKSFLINLHFLRFYHRGKNPSIEMQNGFSTEISRRTKKDLIARLELITSHTF